MIKINLLPKDQIRELKLELIAGQVTQFWMWSIISLIVVFTLSLSGTFLVAQKIDTNKAEIESKKRSLSSESTKQLEQEVSSLNRQIALVNSLRNNHYYWSKALVEMTYMLDSGTIITQLRMDRETGKVEVTGTARNRDEILAFWSSVNKSQLFKDINFPLTNLDQETDAQFNFVFYVKPEEIIKE